MTLCWLNLKVLGFNCIEHDYLSSCFTGISQSESLDGQLSDPLPVNIGVHQGSILGLLLFLQYLNYLPTVTESCNINVFADDIEIGYTAKQGVFDSVYRYFDVNTLSINVHKWLFILIGTHQSIAKMADAIIHINNDPLKHVLVAKYLGVYIV